jgi:hypothetical protein
LSVIRRWRYRDHHSIREISRRTGLSRNTVRKYLCSDSVEPKFNISGPPEQAGPSVVCLKAILDREDVRLPPRTDGTGKATGGGLISRGHLYKILSNPIYIGRLTHHGQACGERLLAMDLRVKEIAREIGYEGEAAIPAPECCPCCGSTKLSKLGEDITETLEVVPRQWKVVQTVRERFSCRLCEAITQPPAPAVLRGWGGRK